LKDTADGQQDGGTASQRLEADRLAGHRRALVHAPIGGRHEGADLLPTAVIGAGQDHRPVLDEQVGERVRVVRGPGRDHARR
jgi:hypothetical protein